MVQATIVRPCPLCASSEHSHEVAQEAYDPEKLGQYAFASRKTPEYMHYRLLLCTQCDLLYASPVPERQSLTEEYRTAAYDSGVEARYAARTYAGILRKMLDGLPDRSGALDIGAGDGAFLKELLELGFTAVVGAEPSAAPIAAAEESIRPLLRHAPFQGKDFARQQFRLITCFQTIEHVSDPLELCREAYDILKPGGAMLCVAHNRLSLSARLLGRRSPIYDIEHLQLFSHPSAKRLLETAGFQDVHTTIVYNCYPLSYWLRLFPLPRFLKRTAITTADSLLVGRVPVPLPAGNLAVYGVKR